jgi:hypothetical protein
LNHSAIIYFKRSSGKEARSKRWHHKFQVQEQISSQLILCTQKVLEKSGIPVILIDEHKQTGETFGERISNAFEDVFKLGYEKLILVGNDTIGLTANELLKADKLLSSQSGVIGETKDGGSYLIGFQREYFSRIQSQFEGITWQTKTVCDELFDLIQPASRGQFPVKFDLNNASDLALLLKRKGLREIKQQILLILSSLNEWKGPKKNKKHINSTWINTISFRGPPLVFV